MPKLVRKLFWGLTPLVILSVSSQVRAQATDVDCNKCVDAADIAAAAINNSKLAPKSVTATNIRPGAVQSGKIAAGAVTAGKIRAGAVTADKLSSEVTSAIDSSLGGIILQQASSSDGSGVAGLTCPVNTIVGSAQCDCDSANNTRNYGVLFGCQVAGNGGIAGCFPEAGTFNPNLPSPIATITLVCASAVRNDGTPIEPIFFIAGLSASSKIDNSGFEFETALNKARTDLASYTNALQSR